MHKIRKDDNVVVIAGKDKAKQGKVLKVSPVLNRAIVEGINLTKKHMRRRQQDQQAGIVQVEAPIHISNLMLLCKNCNRPTRVGFSILKDGSRVRICKKCKAAL